ncbi:hypothetical protein IU500_28710 [Nocardia terpenica]|nr:hypothetical protein [Nocardia terpenica]MBF6065269.1 hypothetical protein [Nocardia terpenica]MBF6107996.1 hypothetical protein [Nocardia terpenica]MBF6115473.1 hypothetical protein [Nocardia terpenica]MBF6121910.1 hypothetical protein [Nocardia terpenica]MBF6155546.1 hypothetical protein [Nocardia terpenica]
MTTTTVPSSWDLTDEESARAAMRLAIDRLGRPEEIAATVDGGGTAQ